MILAALLSAHSMDGQRRSAVVVDSVTRMPLANASVFDRNGNTVGVGTSKGRLPFVAAERYPITVRYLGYGEKEVSSPDVDTVYLSESTFELPEVMVETRRSKVLHLLAYVREYSTLSTYSDTIFLFREKMVDYMIPKLPGSRFRGWSNPRIIKTRSYYRFTNAEGLDSVSDRCNHHFSWSDWVGLPPTAGLPSGFLEKGIRSDTVMGRYSPAEIWTGNDDRIAVDINVLADTLERRWVPNFGTIFKKGVEFENFRVRFNYDNVLSRNLAAEDLTGYSYNIASDGRGRRLFRFNNVGEAYFVSTYGEVYVVDKEYITEKEAKKWDKADFDSDDIEIYQAMDAPPLAQSIQNLVERVSMVDERQVRLAQTPDLRLMKVNSGEKNFSIGNRALSMLKQLTGITLIKSRKNFKNRWEDFRKQRRERNNSHPVDSIPAQ